MVSDSVTGCLSLIPRWNEHDQRLRQQRDVLGDWCGAVAELLDSGSIIAAVLCKPGDAFAHAPDRIKITLEVFGPHPSNRAALLIGVPPVGLWACAFVRVVGHEGSYVQNVGQNAVRRA